MSNESYKSNKDRQNKAKATNNAVQCPELPVSKCYATLADAHGNDIKIGIIQGRIDSNTFIILLGKDKTFKIGNRRVDAREQNRKMMAGHGFSEHQYVEVFGKLEDQATVDQIRKELKRRNLKIDFLMADYMGNMKSGLFSTHLELVKHCFADKCQVTVVLLNTLRGRRGLLNTPCSITEYHHGVEVHKPNRTTLTPTLAKSYDHSVELAKLSFGCGVLNELRYKGAYFDQATDHPRSGSDMIIFSMVVDKTVKVDTTIHAKKVFKAIRDNIGYTTNGLQYKLELLERKYFQMYDSE